MKDDDKLSADELALLGALAASDERPRVALDEAMADELAAHRALVSELRGLPEQEGPNWQQLEASIRRACDEAQAKPPRWWSWEALRQAWRLPTLGMGAAAMASLALFMWARAPKPVELPLDAAPRETRLAVQTPERRDAALPELSENRTAAMYLDDEVVDDIDENGVNELMQQLPDEAAFTLGAAEETSEDDDELLPGGAYDDDIDQLDDEALRALDRWLETEQKG